MSIFSNEYRETAFNIRDCYVWSEIHYLDSPTDYREYLPHYGAYAHSIPSNDFVLLDSSSHLSTHRHYPLIASLILILIIGLLLWYGLR